MSTTYFHFTDCSVLTLIVHVFHWDLTRKTNIPLFVYYQQQIWRRPGTFWPFVPALTKGLYPVARGLFLLPELTWTSTHLIFRLCRDGCLTFKTAPQPVTDFKPDQLFLVVGTNDLHRSDITPETFVQDVISLVKHLLFNVNITKVVALSILH